MTGQSSRSSFTRRLALAVIAAAVIARPVLAQQATDPDASYEALLVRYVKPNADGVNRVDYTRWHTNKADRNALDTYVLDMQTRRPSAMPRAEALAFWGNLYNAVTLKVVLDNFPVSSIRDIKSNGSWFDLKSYAGPWREQRVTVEGKKLSLDNIEHDMMRPVFKDPRVHYVVNCSSYGCPNLMNRAWRAATLEADLDIAARAFVNHSRGVTVLPSGALKVSSIYKWFAEDFGGGDAGVIAHFKKFAEPALAQRLNSATTIAEDAYDWSLNGEPSAKAIR